MASNKKIESGLVAVKRKDKKGVLRTVYIRQDDSNKQDTASVALSEKSVRNDDSYQRTPCDATAAIGLGSSIEEADETLHRTVREVEEDPDLMKNPKMRDRVISCLGYASERAKAKKNVLIQDIKEGRRVHDDENKMIRRIDDADTQQFVDMEKVKKRAPEIYDQSTSDGSLTAETLVMEDLAEEINAAVAESERKQQLDDDAKAAKSRNADDDQQRCEDLVTEYAKDGAGDIEGQPVTEAQKKVDENIKRKNKKRRSLFGRETNDHVMRNSSNTVNVMVKANSKMTIYELHAKLDEMISNDPSGAESAQRSRQIQAEMYSQLVSVKASKRQRKQQRKIEKEQEVIRNQQLAERERQLAERKRRDQYEADEAMKRQNISDDERKQRADDVDKQMRKRQARKKKKDSEKEKEKA